MLKRAGAEVKAVPSAAAALAAVAESPPHVIVSDIAMPDQDGYDLVRALRAKTGTNGTEIPAIALTAYASDEDRARSLSAGFKAHVAKPIEPAELIAAVRKLRSAGAAIAHERSTAAHPARAP